MKVYHNLSEYTSSSKAVVTVGTFDGVHIGHQTLLNTIKDEAKKDSYESVLLTFWPHPRLVLFPDSSDLKLLNTLEEKIDRLEKTGIDHLIIHPFSREFSRTTALDYVTEILVGSLDVSELVIGYDHHFGRNREGNLENLKALAPAHGFRVKEIPAQEIDDVNVSSTKIRRALMEGDVTTANEYLGYTYMVSGEVTNGAQIGRTIDYPTANIALNDELKLIPGNGVYACRVRIDGQVYGGMANIGRRPTVSEQEESKLEVHIFNFDQTIYGKKVEVSFIQNLRKEVKFENVNQLKEQLDIDADRATQILDRLGAVD